MKFWFAFVVGALNCDVAISAFREGHIFFGLAGLIAALLMLDMMFRNRKV